MEHISGVVERITYENPENGYCVIKIRSQGHSDLVTVVGSLATVNVGAVLRFKGEWRMDGRYGYQFNAIDYRETLPATAAGIEKYLGSGLIKGIGPVFAKRIVSCFKEDSLRVLEEEPDLLVEVEGIGRKRVEMIKTAWQAQKEIKNIMLFLQSHDVSPVYAVKIFKTYGNDSIDIVETNPYRLAEDIWGIGFITADRIARKMGFDMQSAARIRAGIQYVLSELADQGHCFVQRQELLKACEAMLETAEPQNADILEEMLAEGLLFEEEGDLVYLPPFYYSEIGVAERLNRLFNSPGIFHGDDPDSVVSDIERELGINYDSQQIYAIKTASSSKIMVLTGGPGTGKTTTIRGIIRAYKDRGARILLAAPTGRAAKRMTEATGVEARTIHRLLELKPGEGYQKNAQNQLECDLLIVDESSMIDIILMYNLLKALPDMAALVLAGDVDQLPSVGPGNVLKDIIDSGVIPIVRLERIFRQASGSRIITNAHLINKGQLPDLKGGRASDFFFIEEENPEQLADTIRSLCSTRLPSYYSLDSLKDIQVLCPMQKGVCGVQNLNSMLQEALNPATLSIRYGATAFKLGDRVMQIKNNYDKNVFNGDIGLITQINSEDRTIRIDFDGSAAEYDSSELDEVVLAYAITVHKSQGCEFPVVVAPVAMQHYMMLQRNLLYTCVTRAQKVLVLVGSRRAIAVAVKNNKIIQRNTRLAARLQELANPCFQP